MPAERKTLPLFVDLGWLLDQDGPSFLPAASAVLDLVEIGHCPCEDEVGARMKLKNKAETSPSTMNMGTVEAGGKEELSVGITDQEITNEGKKCEVESEPCGREIVEIQVTHSCRLCGVNCSSRIDLVRRAESNRLFVTRGNSVYIKKEITPPPFPVLPRH